MPAANMITKGNSAILVEAEYMYKPILTDLVPGFNVAIKWTDQIAHAPRGRCPNYAGKDCKCELTGTDDRSTRTLVAPIFRRRLRKLYHS